MTHWQKSFGYYEGKCKNAHVIKIIVFLQILRNKDIFHYDYLIFIIGRLFLNVKNILQNSSGQKCVLEKIETGQENLT